MMSHPAAETTRSLIGELAETLHAAQHLMRSAVDPQGAALPPTAPSELLVDCRSPCEQRPPTWREPLRTLHHFACTGGTLISKCIAALPNVQLLSEVDPLSPYQAPTEDPGFAPTDMVTLLRHSSRGVRQALIVEMFRRQIGLIHDDATQRGLRLVVRDHAHSHFCHGTIDPARPNLCQLMPPDRRVLSLITVRHPLDSFASLLDRGWVQFEPATLDAYCRRQMRFLDSHPGVPVLRYEDFVAAPQPAMQRICKVLDLRFDPRFAERFAGLRVSGDSGRCGRSIGARPPTPRATALQAEAATSDHFILLAERLGYGLAPGACSG